MKERLTMSEIGIDMRATGRNIRGIMSVLGITVPEISEAAGISEQAVYKWLSGETLPSLDNLGVLRDVLMTGVDDLIVWKERM